MSLVKTDTSQFCPQVIDPSVCLTEKIEEKYYRYTFLDLPRIEATKTVTEL